MEQLAAIEAEIIAKAGLLIACGSVSAILSPAKDASAARSDWRFRPYSPFSRARRLSRARCAEAGRAWPIFFLGKSAGGRGALGLLRRGEAAEIRGGRVTSLLSNFSRARGGAKLAGNLSCVVKRIPLHCEGKRLDVTLAARWRRRRAVSHKCSSRSSVSTVLPTELAFACHSWRRGGDHKSLPRNAVRGLECANRCKLSTLKLAGRNNPTLGMANSLYSFGKVRDHLPSGPI